MPATTIRLDDELYERLRLYVYSRKMIEPGISMSQVVNAALRRYFAEPGAGIVLELGKDDRGQG